VSRVLCRRGAWLESALLFAIAAAYFSLGWSLTMEWMDQGQLLYPSWRVSEGAVPLRDFAQMYGPSTFYFLGWLLRAFGPDVLVVRVALIAVKALIAVIAYAITIRISSRPAALAAFAFNVAVLGTPWWLFNTPYPNHFALLLNLAGFWVFLAFRRWIVLASLSAGLCFGTSATFKQTLGLFALMSIAWFAIYEREDAEGAPSEPVSGGIRALRLLVLAGSFLLFAAYAAKYPHAWTDAVLLGSIAGVVFVLGWRERSFPPSRSDQALAVRIVLGAGVGFALPIAACVAYYARLGALDRLAFSTATVPAAMDWFVPIALPKLRTVLLVAAATSAAVGVGGRRPIWVLSLVALAGFSWSVGAREGFSSYVRTEAWIGEIFAVVFWMPVVLCVAKLIQLAHGQASLRSEAGAVLMSLYGVAALQHLYPSADFWHLANMLPVYAILLGHQLDRLVRRRVPHPRPLPRGAGEGAIWARAALAAGLIMLLVLPFSYSLIRARIDRGPRTASIPRATGIFDPSPKFADAAAVLSYLADPERATRGLLVVSNEQMIYFIAGRPSVWDGQEFLLYLVEAGLLQGERARSLVDEPALLRRLKEGRPLIIDYTESPASRRVWDAFPAIGGYVSQHYRPLARFGKYVVLDEPRT
jgi:hypothetical protein